MGLFRKRVENGVRGTARIVSVSRAPHAARYGNLRMTVVIEAPGIPAYSYVYNKMVMPVDRWPSPGEVVPAIVDPRHPRRVEIPWDELPTNRDSALQHADQMAAMLRQHQGGPAAPGGSAGGGADVPPEMGGLVGQLQQMFPGAVVQVGNDPAAPPDGTAPPPPGPAAGPGPGAGPGVGAGVRVVAGQSNADPVERLEKLARLRDAGIVDQAQFEQLRSQILDQAGLDDDAP